MVLGDGFKSHSKYTHAGIPPVSICEGLHLEIVQKRAYPKYVCVQGFI